MYNNNLKALTNRKFQHSNFVAKLCFILLFVGCIFPATAQNFSCAIAWEENLRKNDILLEYIHEDWYEDRASPNSKTIYELLVQLYNERERILGNTISFQLNHLKFQPEILLTEFGRSNYFWKNLGSILEGKSENEKLVQGYGSGLIVYDYLMSKEAFIRGQIFLTLELNGRKFPGFGMEMSDEDDRYLSKYIINARNKANEYWRIKGGVLPIEWEIVEEGISNGSRFSAISIELLLAEFREDDNNQFGGSGWKENLIKNDLLLGFMKEEWFNDRASPNSKSVYELFVQMNNERVRIFGDKMGVEYLDNSVKLEILFKSFYLTNKNIYVFNRQLEGPETILRLPVKPLLAYSYIISTESFLRGQILLTLEANGHKFPELNDNNFNQFNQSLKQGEMPSYFRKYDLIKWNVIEKLIIMKNE